MAMIKLCVKESPRAPGACQYMALTELAAPDLTSSPPLDTEWQVPRCIKDSGETYTDVSQNNQRWISPREGTVKPPGSIHFPAEDSHHLLQQRALMVNRWLLNKTCILFATNLDSAPAQRKGHGRQRQDTHEESKQATGNLAALAESTFLTENQRIRGNSDAELSNCNSKMRTDF